VGYLQNLLNLQVFNNQLKSLPDSVANLQNLIDLVVSNNQLKSLPDSVGNLQNLRNLKVFNNQLESLPDSVGQLQNLFYLHAWNNTLTSLPKTIGNIKSLSEVDVRHNGLTNLPSSVSQWSWVEYLYLAGNPLCADLNIPSNLKGAKGLCEQQCSADCPASWLDDGVCGDNDFTYYHTKNVNPNAKPKPNSGCNTKSCNYDDGDCPAH
jgi:Leucine-rich repeat (LRR) protein